MKADAMKLMADLMGANKVLFRIPVYQRNYDWDESDCRRLLDDIKNIIDTDDRHFLGTIVYMATDGNDFVLHDYIIIDGQQRITTMMILLKALYEVAAKAGDQSTMDDIDDYIKKSKEEAKQEGMQRLEDKRNMVAREKNDLEKQKAILDTYNKERDREVKMHDIDTKLKIAKENKNRYDKPKK